MFQQIYEMLVIVKKSEHILLTNLALPDLPKGRNFPRTRLYCLCSASFPRKTISILGGGVGVMLLCD